MSAYDLIHQLIGLVEEFERETGGGAFSVQEFAGFLLKQIEHDQQQATAMDVRFGAEAAEAQQMAFQVDNAIARLVIYMSRYAKSYIKKALDGTPLQSGEDFTCLAILLTHQSLTKTELINRNIQEKTSGTEVIRRLLAAGLVTQWDDPEDRRGKRVAITDDGRALLYRVFSDMNHVGKIVTGKLSLAEKLTLQYLLQKLEDYHYPIHEQKIINDNEDLVKISEEKD
jgi:DNA-binding MarR family transcriptional regulator